MTEKVTPSPASVREGYHCAECGWPIVDAACNGSFSDFADAKNWDWWLYCSNKGCVNHRGTGVFQDWPTWAKKDRLAGDCQAVPTAAEVREECLPKPPEPGRFTGEGFYKGQVEFINAMTSIALKSPPIAAKIAVEYPKEAQSVETETVLEIVADDPRGASDRRNVTDSVIVKIVEKTVPKGGNDSWHLVPTKVLKVLFEYNFYQWDTFGKLVWEPFLGRIDR